MAANFNRLQSIPSSINMHTPVAGLLSWLLNVVIKPRWKCLYSSWISVSSPSGLLGLERKCARGDLMEPKNSSHGLYIASWSVIRPPRLLSSVWFWWLNSIVLHPCDRLHSSGAYVPCVTAQTTVHLLPLQTFWQVWKEAAVSFSGSKNYWGIKSFTPLRHSPAWGSSLQRLVTTEPNRPNTHRGEKKRKKRKQFPRISGIDSTSVRRQPWGFPPAENVLEGVHCKPKGLDMIVQNLINPSTAPACKISGLKSAHIHSRKQRIWWSCQK